MLVLQLKPRCRHRLGVGCLPRKQAFIVIPL